MPNLELTEVIGQKIYLIRGHKVMIDTDIAQLYDVKTKRLNEQVKRNIRRFPTDFMFQLTKKEKCELVANCDRFKQLKHSTVTPYAFTEQGVAILSSVLNSDRAIQVNIAIMRAFVKLRQVLSTNKALAHKLEQLERKTEKHDTEIQAIFEAIRQLMKPPAQPRRRIGFHKE
ncbi:MAG: ORF6N domain-containing protein [Candidatus Orphnella occulta]|nr:ORF6N domain-containing protein [Candidatus Orphnella occulta]